LKLSFWLNDVDGDCVTAEEAFKCAASTPEIFITDADVRSWAASHGVLNGAVIADVMTLMQKSGFAQDGNLYNDGTHVAVDWTDVATLQNAIWQGPVKIGVAATQLEHVVPDPPSNGWFATGFTTDANEDHCVSLCGFGTLAWLAAQFGVVVPTGLDGSTPGYALFTWSSVGIVDVPSMTAITGEAWLRKPSTVVEKVAASITSLSVTSNVVPRGTAVNLKCVVSALADVSDEVWLGASMWNEAGIFWNIHEDKPIALLNGTHEYDRSLTVPAAVPPGNYTLRADIWRGVLGDSKQSVLVATGAATVAIIVT
jgi:hypothetical protein